MDYIRKFDIELEKDTYYAGETLTGVIAVVNTENIKVQRIRLILRGKAHAEWKVNRAGERRMIRQDEYYINEQRVVWGKEKGEETDSVPIMPRGNHKYPFDIKLPESALPCSFESKIGTIRYYIRVIMDIPYASTPQGIKYFTIIGPHIDCMDERYLAPCHAKDKRYSCCLCCTKGPIVLQATLERSAYCCGEHIRLKAETENGSDQNVWVVCRLMQYVEYFLNKGVLGVSKELSHKVWEYKTEVVSPHQHMRYENLQDRLQVPVMPPTLINVVLVMDKTGEALDLEFPITIATVPFRIPNTPSPELQMEVAKSNVEGGIYISSEFQMGQVYMGQTEDDEMDEVILYRPVYVCVPHQKMDVTNTGKASRENSELTIKSHPSVSSKDALNILMKDSQSEEVVSEDDNVSGSPKVSPTSKDLQMQVIKPTENFEQNTNNSPMHGKKAQKSSSKESMEMGKSCSETEICS